MHPKIATGRVAIYARYSTDRQSETSIEDQVRRAREVITRAGGDPGKALVFPDVAVSGASMVRPGLEAMMQAVNDGHLDVIVTEDISRISRDLADSAQIFKHLQFAGVPLIGISDGIDTSQKHAKLNYAVKSLLADLYLDDLRDKTLRGLEGRALAGFATGQVPYGYRTAARSDRSGRPVGNEIVIEKNAAAIVRRIFQEYRDGAAYYWIARGLNHDAVPSPRARTRHTRFGWGAPGISGMLRNEKYIGIWRFKETQWVKVPGTNRRMPRKRPAEEVITLERPDLRIIDDDLWTEVQRRLADVRQLYKGGARDRVMGLTRRSRYMLSGILVCDDCGKPMTVAGSTTTYYRCGTRYSKGTCQNDLWVREDTLKTECLDAISSQVRTPSAIAYVRSQIEERLRSHSETVTSELRERRARLDTIEKRLKELVEFVATGHGSKTIAKELSALEAQADQDRTAIPRLEREAKEAPALPSPDSITRKAFQVRRLLQLEPDTARMHLRSWLKDGEIRVTRTPAGFEIRGVCYPLLMVDSSGKKKPKDDGSLGPVEKTISSGGRI
jgi:site-specific DNA recombinase